MIFLVWPLLTFPQAGFSLKWSCPQRYILKFFVSPGSFRGWLWTKCNRMLEIMMNQIGIRTRPGPLIESLVRCSTKWAIWRWYFEQQVWPSQSESAQLIVFNAGYYLKCNIISGVHKLSSFIIDDILTLVHDMLSCPHYKNSLCSQLLLRFCHQVLWLNLKVILPDI